MQKQISKSFHIIFQRLYKFSNFDSIENVELYRPGGLHLVSIGDVCTVAFKYCTNWVGEAHQPSDLHETSPQSSASDTLVALKILFLQLNPLEIVN